jgi:transcriptional regulator with XRE-family HTH domain
MTNLRDLLAFNMKTRRRELNLSQARLAEKAGTSAHYIGTIEVGKKFPTPEMLEKIAIALEIDTPELFSTALYPSETKKTLQNLQNQIIADINQVIAFRIRELDQENQANEATRKA